jgi:biopolymer transport protein ExbD
MRLSTREQRPWQAAATAVSLLTVATFAVVLTALLITTATLTASVEARVGSSAAHRRTGPQDLVGTDSGVDSDLEVPVVEVGKQGAGVVYRLGSRDAGSAAELQQLLEPLAKVGGAISVRISHDVPFARSAEAIAACRDAGFATVRLVASASKR